MSNIMFLIGTAALLGSALVGGIFFAFSSFVMRALAKLPSASGISAMQTINVVVLNRSFLSVFMGTTVLAVVLSGIALLQLGQTSSAYFLAGAQVFVLGTFLVTVFGNVPLNNRLAALTTTSPGAAEQWRRYLVRWTRWNHVRTVAAMVAVLLFSLGLVQNGGLV